MDYFNKICNEYQLAKVGSDDGLLPIYSLLGDWSEEAKEDSLLRQAILAVRAKIDALFDEARPFDAGTLSSVQSFIDWFKGGFKSKQPFTVEESQTVEKVEVIEHEKKEDFSTFDTLMVIDLSEDTEILQEFYSEATEHLEQIENYLLNLEKSPEDPEALAALFRSFHTIKGVAGFLNLKPIQSLAHEIEFLLDKARNHELILNSGTITLILQSKDTLNAFVGQVSDALHASKAPSEIIPISHLVAAARKAIQGGTVSLPAAQATPTTTPEASPHAPKAVSPESSAAAPARTPPEKTIPAPTTAAKANASNSASIRVNTNKLDSLLDTVGELVITQSQLMESAKHLSDKDSTHLKHLAQLVRISKELQHTSMSLRMVPIGATFQKMGRIVRDVSTKLDKKVELSISGEDTELDRSIVELIGDPLVHMVRNAVDHGVEKPADRIAAGKPETGYVELKAYHMGGNIIIDLIDDGKGLNAEVLLEKARSKGLVPAGQHFTDEEIYQFIFLPGFSTAAVVTDVSGRGVGMDVVKRNIESLRGTVSIESTLGKGSLFRIKLPLTTAIIDGLLVRVGKDRFIIPTLWVKVTLRPETNQIKRMQGGMEILDLRGKSIPILRLHRSFGIADASEHPEESILIILETAGQPLALMVDEMLGKQEVVIKSIGDTLGNVKGITGGAILGDGTVALILDPSGLKN